MSPPRRETGSIHATTVLTPARPVTSRLKCTSARGVHTRADFQLSRTRCRHGNLTTRRFGTGKEASGPIQKMKRKELTVNEYLDQASVSLMSLKPADGTLLQTSLTWSINYVMDLNIFGKVNAVNTIMTSDIHESHNI